MTKSRLIAAYIFVIIAFVLLILRYAYLQLIDHGSLLKQSIDNYTSIVATLPVRGAITDRNGIILANSAISYAVAILPRDYKKSSDLLNQILPYINITELDKKIFFNQLKYARNFDWVIIKDDLSNTEIANLTAHAYMFPQIMVFARAKRSYPFADIYAHSIGYVGRVSTSDSERIAKLGKGDYLNNDYIGKSGLEEYYEPLLRGNLGKKIIQTDVLGNEVGLLKNIPANDGNNIQLTLDNGLQELAWHLLGSNKGAIVALEPQTGSILAFVSKPGFNPSWFIDGISTEAWQGLKDDPDNPLLNRAVQGTYPPGSTFKPFLGLSALYLGYRTAQQSIFDPGFFVIPGSTHHFRDNDHPHGLGEIDLLNAIAVSSDTYFYKLAYDMGIDNIDKSMELFGFGNKTGVDLPHENPGLLPSREWKAKRFAHDLHQRQWLPADSVAVGIGQGFNNYTPLQLAYAVSIVANDGVAVKPHFLDKVLDKNGKIISQYLVSLHKLNIPQSDFALIKQAMQMVITKGTAHSINYGLRYTMAGKTGTAQVVSTIKNGRVAKFAGKKFKDHAWFIAFAPVDHPKIAVAILVENGGFGAATAAPIARHLFDYYLLGQTVRESLSNGLDPQINLYP